MSRRYSRIFIAILIVAITAVALAMTAPAIATVASSTAAAGSETASASEAMDIDPRVLKAVETWGPLAVLFLLVMPLMGEDIIIIPAGFLIGQGHLPWWSTFFCAWIGAMISDGAWYFICYRYGTPLLHKKWFKRLAHPRRLLQAKHQIEQRGAWLIVTARFVPGSRTSTMIVAGLMHMPPWKYLTVNGGLLLATVAMQLGLGWLIAHHVVGSTSTAGKIMAIVGLIMVLLAGALILNWWAGHRTSKERAPRSKVTWLKRFRPHRARKKKSESAKLKTESAAR